MAVSGSIWTGASPQLVIAGMPRPADNKGQHTINLAVENGLDVRKTGFNIIVLIEMGEERTTGLNDLRRPTSICSMPMCSSPPTATPSP